MEQEIASQFSYALLRHTPWDKRKAIAKIKADAMNIVTKKVLNMEKLEEILFAPTSNDDAVAKLREEGYVNLGKMLTDKQISEVLAYFSKKKGYPNHIASTKTQQKSTPDFMPAIRDNGNYWCSFTASDSLRCPHLLDILKSPQLIDIVSKYLGCLPSIYCVNTWWTFKNQLKIAPIAQRFHRDPDDFRFVAFFLYLSNTEEGNGSHEMVRKSHDYDLTISHLHDLCKRHLIDDYQIKHFIEMSLFEDGNTPQLDNFITDFLSNDIIDLHGKAGTAFLEDTWSLHRAVPFANKDRLVIWCRYGISPNSETCLNGYIEPSLDGRLFSSSMERCIFRHYIND